ncbi:MAG: hypothetical protein FLDDKLPJ_03683 [Phycisphaerae bacterium]|nr:hypothetical protein [Phycisphaerae bacterium]
MKKRFYRNDDIEALAEQRLAELERILERPLSPPIPIDLVGEQVLGLQILWDDIEELPGEIIFGGIMPKERLVILNDRRKAEFAEKPGLERSTKGHEMGHWDLFVDKATLDHPALFDMGDGPFSLRSCHGGEAAVLKKLRETREGQDLLRQIESRADEPDEARAVNRYAAALSMPKRIIREEALKIDRTKWPNLYRLAERFEVTISALRVRLEQLGLLHIDKHGKLHESLDKASGQMSLF